MTEQYGFSDLEQLRSELIKVSLTHVTTLERYITDKQDGFCHLLATSHKDSLASTSTCVSSLVKAGRWKELTLGPTQEGGAAPKKPLSHEARAAQLTTFTARTASKLISKNNSAKLGENNPFSLSFVVEGVLDCIDAADQYEGASQHLEKIETKIAPLLAGYLSEGYLAVDFAALSPEKQRERRSKPGAISIWPYPPSAYLTQLVYRVVERCGKSTPDIKRYVQSWSRSEVLKQIALITAKSRSADPLQLAYAIILSVITIPDEDTTPEDKEIFSHALALFFHSQKEDGTWPASSPMFHYADVGSAYSFEYEVLAQLLACAPLRDELLLYLPQLRRSVANLKNTHYDLSPSNPGKQIAWASGHHPQLRGAESWSTASVYQFAFALERLVAEAIRRSVFRELKVIYQGSPKASKRPTADDDGSSLAPGFLDADLNDPAAAKPQSLIKSLATRFVYPIARDADSVGKGRKLPGSTPMSAILYGPPGTSKTELAKIVSTYLNWPLLSVDPSYVVKEGIDNVQPMANRLFDMLLAVEQIVVLLDEFDEMGRDRAGNDNILSRFITTAMLPKLAEINKERKIVFLLATNYLTGFDAAFRRGGRFDMQLQVMQPNLTSKLVADTPNVSEGWGSTLSTVIRMFKKPAEKKVIKAKINDFTFLETRKVVQEIQGALNGGAEAIRVQAIIDAAWKVCTLEKANDTGFRRGDPGAQPDVSGTNAARAESANSRETWRTTCEKERLEIRLPS
ncbi:AAA family ATPase [Mesorhizobium sp. B3-1-6]|uniref:ATP-binding protein n=1 Tax=Mesorhizobium sp. B3-1-6 TaxID=2589895 RepID=UPI0011281410|nr:ATP-binding protein [Mesorhizobium sp. B3-1-6]TPI29434.1 AAA family ATPase [Mesorhizobium sp. B3-1-6]